MGVAVRCSAYGDLSSLEWVKKVPPLVPGKNQVLIDVAAAGLSYVDLLILAGNYQSKPALPFVPGGEVSGRIAAVGEGCRRLSVSQIVYAACGVGGMASQVLVDESQVFPAPMHLSAAEAATVVSPFGTAYHALADRAGLQKGMHILVLGASGALGSAAIQVGKMLQATITATTSSADKATYLRKQGANHVLVGEGETLKEQLMKSPLYHVVFDPLGGAYSEMAFRRLLPKGRHLVLGFVSGSIPRLPLNLPLLKVAEVRGVFWSRFRREEASQNRKNFAILSNAFSQRKLRPLLSEQIPLKDFAQAIQLTKDRTHVGKVALIPPPKHEQ